MNKWSTCLGPCTKSYGGPSYTQPLRMANPVITVLDDRYICSGGGANAGTNAIHVYPGVCARAGYPGVCVGAGYPGGCARAGYPGRCARAGYPDVCARAGYPGGCAGAGYSDGVQLRDILAGVQLRDILAGVQVCVLTWQLILDRLVPCQCKHGFKFRIDGNNTVYLNVSTFGRYP